MQFPEKATCHAGEYNPVFVQSQKAWEFKANPNYGDELRRCGYCGSLHPEAFLLLLKVAGTRVEMADMKYGWPHKVYLTLPGGRMAKFYTEHLQDEGFDDEARAAVVEAIYTRTGFVFRLAPDGRLQWAKEGGR